MEKRRNLTFWIKTGNSKSSHTINILSIFWIHRVRIVLKSVSFAILCIVCRKNLIDESIAILYLSKILTVYGSYHWYYNDNNILRHFAPTRQILRPTHTSILQFGNTLELVLCSLCRWASVTLGPEADFLHTSRQAMCSLDSSHVRALSRRSYVESPGNPDSTSNVTPCLVLSGLKKPKENEKG